MDNLFKFKHVDGSSKSGTGYPQFYMNAFFWREQLWAMSNQHNWSLQLAIQCCKSNSIMSMKECTIIWSSVSHIKPLWTFIPWILTYADLEHNWSLQLAIQCYKSNSIMSMKECIIIWSSIFHKKPLRTLFSRILTYADLDPRPLDVFALIEEALVIILQIASDN